jgi:hypothetical protein
MSAASPFRSHLLQQWARTNQKRPPMAVVPWLKPTSGDKGSDPEEDSLNRRRRRHGGRKHSSSSRHSHGPPSLSSVDSNSFASAPSWKESCDSSRKTAREFSSSVASIPHSPSTRASLERTSHLEKKRFGSVSEESHDQDIDDDDDEYLSSALRSLLLNRRTATRLTFTLENREAEKHYLMEALDRAVECAQMAPNHKCTEPFSFTRFLASSQASQDLAEISYQVTLAKTQSVPNAEGKRKKWLEIPAFLVASVHENQSPVEYTETMSSYEALPFSPPETERQLEDVSVPE